jgi:hypothetical protein
MSEFKKLDQMQRERSKSYSRFEEYGEDYIDVMSSGIPALENTWVSANQILEASDEEKSVFQEKGGNRIFTSIYNLLCDANLLPAFHDSPPYEINTQQYESETIIEAWKDVSGEEYSRPEERNGSFNLEESLYQQLKD